MSLSSGVLFLLLSALSVLSLPVATLTQHCETAAACSLLLEVGMTEPQVIAALGRHPSSAEAEVCDQSVCKTLHYVITEHGYFHRSPGLVVHETRSHEEWHVNGWKIQ